ncbi:unnamed protein product [Gongylonema pulchrum]|uniref:G_PROTEIN_RECEP_F1_2 domain-containing protein n=1 Tax=Gongylonema pulchrum TaxID=637853 RepID=A0A183ERB7_9BILA|nr:unnamed protein product [Gongylonema pulchrum]
MVITKGTDEKLPYLVIPKIFLVTFQIYIIQGLLLVISNGSVVYALARHRHLRRRYVILMAQVFADTLMGIGLCSAGIGRLVTMLTGSSITNRQHCLLMPWSIIVVW